MTEACILSFFNNKDHIYSLAEKKNQLLELIKNIEAQNGILKKNDYQTDLIPQFEKIISDAMKLLSDGFTQDSLTSIALSIPSVIYLHKEWIPPLIQTENGYSEPEWFNELEIVNSKIQSLILEIRATAERR